MTEQPRSSIRESIVIEQPNTPDCRQSILTRLEDETLFHSERDVSIARSLLQRLDSGLRLGSVAKKTYDLALEGLDALVPRRNEKGRRVIGDINISPLMELTIHSRLNAKEVDITEDAGSWGSLPLRVRQEIATQTNMLVEMAPTCTVRCSFCALAEKGPITEKVSLTSLTEVFRFYRDNRDIPAYMTVSDGLYWGSDPFDAKWRKADGIDSDYSDVAEIYWGIMRSSYRFLYTSTAIPIGEEFRVVSFVDNLLDKKSRGEISEHNFFRISLTNANKTRVEAIRKVLIALHGSIPESSFEISDNRNEHEARAGKRWEMEWKDGLDDWDIIGPNCRDDVIVGTRSVDGVIMEGSSNERPKGESRFPILNIEESGQTTYTIPHHLEKGSFTDSIYNLYPDTTVTVFAGTGESLQKRVETITNNPHRAFLRLIANVSALVTKYGQKVPDREKTTYRRTLADDIVLVQNYLDAGANNKAMEDFMDWFKDNKYIH